MLPKINSAHGSDTRNIINRTIDVLNQHGMRIQDLVAEGQLTEKQYTELITVINGLIKSGHVDKSDLTSEFKDEIEGSIEQLAEKANKKEVRENTYDRPIDVDEMNTRTKQLFTGGAVAVVGENAVGRENIKRKAVSTSKTDYIKSPNLYDDVVFLPGILNVTSARYNTNESYPDSKVAFLSIQEGETYTIQPMTDENVTINRYATFPDLPESGVTTLPVRLLTQENLVDNPYTFTASEGETYLAVFLNNQGITNIPVAVQVGERIVKPHFDFGKVEIEDNSLGGEKLKDGALTIKKTDFITFANNNLYNPSNTIEGILMSGGRYRSGEDFPNQQTAYIPLDPNETYTIQPVESSLWQFSRYAVFTELPTENNTVAHFLVNDDDSVRDSVTFTNDEEGKYLLIYLSNNTNGLVLDTQVNKGTEADEYKPLGYKIGNVDLTALEEKKSDNKAKLYGNFHKIFNYDTEENILDDLSDPENAQVSDIYALYNAIETQYPNTLSKRVIGYGSTADGEQEVNLPVFEYTLMIPNNINMNTEREELLTYSGDTEYVEILIAAGTHGNEKMTVYALYKFIKNLIESDDETLASIRDNCIIKFVPIVNVSGYNLKTYENGNGINLNKNYSDGRTKEGAEPYSEHETKAMREFFTSNPDADIYIDLHTFRGREGANQVSYHYSFNEDVNKMYATFMRRMSNDWKDRVIHTYVENEALGYSESTFSSNATSYREAYYVYGIEHAALLEFGDGIPDYNRYTDGLLKIGVELVVNYISSMLGRYYT